VRVRKKAKIEGDSDDRVDDRGAKASEHEGVSAPEAIGDRTVQKHTGGIGPQSDAKRHIEQLWV
jgi:hypothetical protein